MTLLVADKLCLGYGKRTLLENAGIRVSDGDRIGLIGPNGSGKSSLLRIFAGAQQADSGSLQPRRGLRIGYLPQELARQGSELLLDYVLQSVPGRQDVERELAACESELAQIVPSQPDAGAIAQSVGERLAALHERLHHYDLHFSEHQATRILAGLGFAPEDHRRRWDELSGGWRMRAILASLLFQQPDLLLLDEPTNHLDMPSVSWFGAFLRSFPHAFVLICHDREFLNEQISRVVSFETEGLRQYPGNYERYLTQRREEADILTNRANNIQREREQAERFVRRFRAQASKARAVQSRIKALERMQDVETLSERKTLRFRFPPTQRAGDPVARVEALNKSFGAKCVLGNVDVQVQRGERIAIIGPNGAGKTTLLRLIANELQADGGRIHFGHNVKLGYYAQHHTETLPPESTALGEVAQRNRDASTTQIRTLLGTLLFSGDEVDKKIGVLSGGERARVALACLLIDPGNFLLMDEPTNHLDLASAEVLADALADYDGTLLFVSHNRSFVRRLATRIWNMQSGTLTSYPGTLDEYMDSCVRALDDGAASLVAASPPQAPKQQETSRTRSRAEDKERKRRQAELRNQHRRRARPLEREVARVEHAITELEDEQSRLTAELASPQGFENSERATQLSRRLHQIKVELEVLTDRWTEVQTELEEVQSELSTA